MTATLPTAVVGSHESHRQVVLDGRDPKFTDCDLEADLDWWRECDEIIVTHVDEPSAYAAALAIAAVSSGEIVVPPESLDGSRCASIAPSAPVEEPEPLNCLPRPASVPAGMPVGPTSIANDYSDLLRHARNGPTPSAPVSIVVPVSNQRVALGRTLACLSHQTYPLDLIEVIIADSDSTDRPEEVGDGFSDVFGDVRYVREGGEHLAVAAVRNLGVRSARHEYVILLDADMAPTPRLVELHVRHLVSAPNALYCGHVRHVDAAHVPFDEIRRSPRPMLGLPDVEVADTSRGTGGRRPLTDWRLRLYASTADLRFESHPFRAVSCANLSFTRSFFDIAGEFDVDLTAPGESAFEWGYRAWNRGMYIVPLIDACALHQMSADDGRLSLWKDGHDRPTPELVDRCPVPSRQFGSGTGGSVPLVSIYIPAYNAEDTIVGAVQSALEQTVTDLEVCVVDDGSTDGTLHLLDEHFRDEPRVRIASQANGGIGAASNRAVRMCRGGFIGQLDADDELTPTAVELVLEPMIAETRLGVAYGSHVKIDAQGNDLGDAYVVSRYSHYTMLHSMIVHHFRLFRARDWYRTTGFAEDIRNAVDYDMYLKMSEVTEMVHVEERVYRYRIHESSTSIKDRTTQYENHAKVVARALERRGVADVWTLEFTHPEDPRRYRFVERADAPRRPALPTRRVRVLGSGQDLQARVASVYPTWPLEQTRDERGAIVIGPPVSERRADRCVETLTSEFAGTDAVVEPVT